MGDGSASGILAVVGIVGCAALYFVSKSLFPELASFILIVLGVVVALLVILVVGVGYLAFRKPEKKPGEVAAEELNDALSKGRSSIMEVRRLAMRIKDPKVRSLSDEICGSADKIIRTLKDKPENISQIRQSFNYYLPTLASILSKYVRLEESGVPDVGMAEKTVSFLEDINSAMDKQYASLFDDDKFDLAVEMEALTVACKRDGLLVGEEFVLHDGGRDIRLTL